MAKSILVPTAQLEAVHKRLARLASKAGVTLEVVPGESRYYRLAAQLHRSKVTGLSWKTLEVDTTQVLVCARLTVGELPATNGYSFVGKICHTEAGNILALAQAPNLPMVVLEAWRTARPTCDHCNTSRKRKDTFIIACPDGSVKRVGRQCLADFIKADPATLVAAADFEDSVRILEESDPDECYGSSGGAGWTIDTFHYLCCAARCTDVNGFWKTRNEQDRTPTSSDAYFAAGSCPRSAHAESVKAWKELQPTTDSVLGVVGALLWLEESTDSSDYFHSLRVACQLPDVRRNTAGLLASLPQAYARAMGQIAERKASAARPDAGNWRSVGERADTEVTILRVNHCDSQWGTTTIVGMRTSEGHDLVTFTTSSDAPGVNDVGATYQIRGTVKSQAPYKGKAQTTLSRVTFTRIGVSESLTA